MTCYEIKTIMHDFVDGTLHPDMVHKFTSHVAECMRCRRDYSDLKKIIDDVQSPVEFAALPDTLLNEIFAGLSTDLTGLEDVPKNLFSIESVPKDSPRKLFGGLFSKKSRE